MIRMVQPITSSLTLDGVNLDTGELLKIMDIATCASAEKHTGVNCVTVAMGDLVLEHSPTVGAILELAAEPVLVGRTSLEIALTVTAERGAARQFVCESFFTYVTTRGPKGDKQLAPPLLLDQASERRRWATTIATHRKTLIQLENKAALSPTPSNSAPVMASTGGDVGAASAGGFLECSEVVLPAHQNHVRTQPTILFDFFVVE